MRILDKWNNEISETDMDLSKGCLVQQTVIRPDAQPVDNIRKFAWADGDYEVIRRFVLWEDLPADAGAPSAGDVTLELLADHEYRLCMLELTHGEVIE